MEVTGTLVIFELWEEFKNSCCIRPCQLWIDGIGSHGGRVMTVDDAIAISCCWIMALNGWLIFLWTCTQPDRTQPRALR